MTDEKNTKSIQKEYAASGKKSEAANATIPRQIRNKRKS